MDFMTFMFGDGSMIYAVDPVTAAISLGTSSVLSFLASRDARKSADKARRGARASENEEIRLADEQLQRARAQDALFAPVIANTVDFFQNTSLEDIASGKAASFRSEPAINTINQSAGEQTRLLDKSLAQRGIGDDAVAQTERGEIERNRGTLIAAEKTRAIDKEISDRLGFINPGLIAARETRLSSEDQQSAQRARTNRLSGIAAQQLQLAGQGASGSVSSATSLANIKDLF